MTAFRATILLSGKTATGVQVPDDVIAGLGAGRKPAVRVTINGYTYRSTVATVSGVFMLPVSAEVRERAGVVAGDEVEVTLERDLEPREVSLPGDLAAALDQDPETRRRFDALSYSEKRRLAEPVATAKSPETRARRIAKAVSELRGL